MARQCDWFDCYKAADVSNVEYPLYCKKHGKALAKEKRDFEAKYPNGVRPHEVDRLRASYGGFQGNQASVQKSTKPQKKTEPQNKTEPQKKGSWKMFWLYACSPIFFAGGPIGTFFAICGIIAAIYEFSELKGRD